MKVHNGNFYDAFVDFIKSEMEKREINQVKLSKMTKEIVGKEVSQAVISNIINKKFAADLDKLEILIKTLDPEMAEILPLILKNRYKRIKQEDTPYILCQPCDHYKPNHTARLMQQSDADAVSPCHQRSPSSIRLQNWPQHERRDIRRTVFENYPALLRIVRDGQGTSLSDHYKEILQDLQYELPLFYGPCGEG